MARDECMAGKVPHIADKLGLAKTDARVIAQALNECGLSTQADEFGAELAHYLRTFDERRVDLPEVAVFSSGRYASAWVDAAGQPCAASDPTARAVAWSEWSDADLQAMARNDALLRASDQPPPYIKPAHGADPVPGFVGPLRYAGGKLYASIKQCVGWMADQILAKTRPWRSAEVLRDARNANYEGVAGPILKSLDGAFFAGLAAISTHPRIKTLHADGIEGFSEPGALPGSFLVTFQEAATMAEISAAKALELRDAVGDDKGLWKKLAAILGLTSEDEGATPVASPEGGAPVAPVAQMSDAAAAKLVKLEADNALLNQRFADEQKRKRLEVAHARAQSVATFADAVSLTHGRAVADRAKASAEARIAALPATENFSDDGKRDLVAEVFAEIAGLLGPATVRRTAGAVVQMPGASSVQAGKAETFADAAKAVYAEASPAEQIVLRNPAFRGALDYLSRKRLAAQKVS